MPRSVDLVTLATLYTLMELIRHADTDVSRHLMLKSMPVIDQMNHVESHDVTTAYFIVTPAAAPRPQAPEPAVEE